MRNMPFYVSIVDSAHDNSQNLGAGTFIKPFLPNT
jgi:hypothetical protein